jgi:uncharacterized protein
MIKRFEFSAPTLPEDLHWFNPPAAFTCGNGLEIFTKPQTDFWQGTHYGFRRDDGHCLLATVGGDFRLTTRVRFSPRVQYDQCGLMVRLDSRNWIKVSTEFENEQISRQGSVVTNLGYSDWATRDISSELREWSYRIHKNGADFLLESSPDDSTWSQIRIAHLHAEFETLEVGLYACSPIGQDFHCVFSYLTIEENDWGYHD